MSASDFQSIKQPLKQMLNEVYKHAQEISRTLSILAISKNLKLQAPVEEGWVKIKFAERPITKYYVCPSYFETVVVVSDTTVAIPPYIDLIVENGIFKDVIVPLATIDEDQYEEEYEEAETECEPDPITALAFVKTVAQRAGYIIEASHQDLKDFVTRFFNEMNDNGVMSYAELLVEEFTKNPRRVKGPPIEIVALTIPTIPIVSIHYSESDMIVYYYHPEVETREESKESGISLIEVQILSYDGRTVKLLKPRIIKRFRLPKPKVLAIRTFEVLNRVRITEVLQEAKGWIANFIQEFAKAVIVAKMYSI